MAGLALASLVATAQGASAAPARTPAARRVAVVSVARGAAPNVASTGAKVLQRYAAVGDLVVSGTPAQLAAVSRLAGVRSVVPNRELQPTGHGPDHAEGVLASATLGGAAGRPGAGAGVTVAVVDTGVSDTEALARSTGHLVDGIDTSGEGRLTDGFGHGTFMANIVAGGPVAATDGRALGVAPGARVVNVKVAGTAGTTSLSKVLAGFDWLLSHRAAYSVDVVSFSFSTARPGTGYGADPLTDGVERLRDAGLTVVVSAGNTAGQVGDPGFDPRVLTVGAADLSGGKKQVASFSGAAMVAGVAKPDLVASGVGVLSLLPPTSEIAQSFPGSRRADGLWRGSGTSQATATTAGAAALFLAEFPSAGPRQVKASLRAAAKNVKGAGGGAGLLALAHAVRDGSDGPGAADGGGDGESGFDANSWGANSWGANSWGANSWGANSWGANSWGANSWGANSWSAAWGEDA
jgi:serine protease AprX